MPRGQIFLQTCHDNPQKLADQLSQLTYHLLQLELGGVDYAHHITISLKTGTARFSDLRTALFCGQMQSPSPHNIQAKVYLQY